VRSRSARSRWDPLSATAASARVLRRRRV